MTDRSSTIRPLTSVLADLGNAAHDDADGALTVGDMIEARVEAARGPSHGSHASHTSHASHHSHVPPGHASHASHASHHSSR